MIFGIGIDQATVSRVKEAVRKRGPKLIDYLFTEKEKKYCESKKDPWPHYAARFAVKESFIKAWGKTVSPLEIEVDVNKNGRPSLTLKGKILKQTEEGDIKKLHLSLSHEGDSAVAVVVLES